MRIGPLAVLVMLPALALADDPKKPPPKPDAFADRTMLEPIQIESLSLTPIVATKDAKGTPDLLVLDEAMAGKLVRIHEVDDGDVNNLTLDNKADRPLFLLAGEVIIGGKQDRIIGRNTIVPAKTKQQVPVFCVEHGRWDGKTGEFTTAKALAHGRLRGKASFDGQQDVWNEVAVKNGERKTSNNTDTYRQVAQQQSDGTLAKWEKRVDTALAKLAPTDRKRLIGFAVAINGQVATVDMFQSPALFGKLQGKLVRSYLTEAIDVAAGKDVHAPTSADVKTFMADAEKAATERSYDTSAAATSVNNGKHAAKATVDYKAPPKANSHDAPAPSAVYETYQSN